MRAILFDCRDKERGCTLRVFDGSGMVMQAAMHGSDPVGFGQRIADLLEIEMTYVGPPEGREAKPVSRPRDQLNAPSPPALAQSTLDTPGVYEVPARDRNQLALF